MVYFLNWLLLVTLGHTFHRLFFVFLIVPFQSNSDSDTVSKCVKLDHWHCSSYNVNMLLAYLSWPYCPKNCIIPKEILGYFGFITSVKCSPNVLSCYYFFNSVLKRASSGQDTFPYTYVWPGLLFNMVWNYIQILAATINEPAENILFKAGMNLSARSFDRNFSSENRNWRGNREKNSYQIRKSMNCYKLDKISRFFSLSSLVSPCPIPNYNPYPFAINPVPLIYTTDSF